MTKKTEDQRRMTTATGEKARDIRQEELRDAAKWCDENNRFGMYICLQKSRQCQRNHSMADPTHLCRQALQRVLTRLQFPSYVQ